MLPTSCHPTELAASAGYAALFITGVTMSAGHCVGMCGPIQLTFAAEQASQRPVKLSLALYHLGRITSYMVIGLVFGLAGASTGLIGSGSQVQGAVTAAAGALMISFGIMGLPNSIHGSPWAHWAARRVGTYLRTGSRSGRFGLGIANGFLPCGPVWAAALSAAALAHPVTGALLMGAYGLGTTPLLAVVGLTARQWSPKVRQRFFRLGTLVVIVLGIQLSLRGAANLGWINHGSIGPFVFW